MDKFMRLTMNRAVYKRLRQLVIALLLVSILPGCTPAISKPESFYQLQEIPDNKLTAIEKGAVVGLGPIQLPEYINRPQIVTRLSRQQIHVSEFNRWIEPLSDGITRTLVIKLANQLNSNRVYWLPRKDQKLPLELRVAIDISRFDGQFNGEVILEGRWSLYNKMDNPLITKVSIIRQPLAGQTYSALVVAMNQALLSFGEEIAIEAKRHLK
jgi:uncharacterized lipoprotein YmbA